MSRDKRKDQRRAMRYSAWLCEGETTPHGCIVTDLSAGGARLEVERDERVPDVFTLLLSGRPPSRRQCRVVWRQDQEIGVTFEKAPHAA